MSAEPRTYHILVAEDSEADAYLIGEAFRECGAPCELTFVRSHVEADERLSRAHFDLLITDFGADYSGACKFIQCTRTLYPRMPVIVLSGMDNAVIPAYDAGATAFIPKGSDLETLFERVRILMHFWTKVVELPTP